MPWNLLTVAVAEGSEVVVPMTASEAIVASGGQLEADTGLEVGRSMAKAVKFGGLTIARIKR
jgi:hypothetical protein